VSHSDLQRLLDSSRSRSRLLRSLFWNKAVTSFKDARSGAISSDAAFQLAYTAALQATLAVLAAHGLRVRSSSNHYTAFLVLQKLDPAVTEHGQRFDRLRQTRHLSIYEPEHDEEEMARRLDRAIERLREGLPALRTAIPAVRPTLQSSLTPLKG
jgi:hypothetical protein